MLANATVSSPPETEGIFNKSKLQRVSLICAQLSVIVWVYSGKLSEGVYAFSLGPLHVIEI